MERTKELVQNLLTAQNELILHLSILKGVPNLARVLFRPLEKNSTPEKNSRPPEKNSTPEKNSSEVEEIRKEWMDDVVGLASEFFINEESFNVKNLSDLMINTACALDALLNLKASVDQDDSVDQTFAGGHVHANHEKKFTFLDKLKEDRPDLTNEDDEYLMERYCISEFGYGKECPNEEEPSFERCTHCWNREYNYSDTDSVDQTEKKITKPTSH